MIVRICEMRESTDLKISKQIDAANYCDGVKKKLNIRRFSHSHGR